jgi:antitoxin HicB
MSDAGDIRGYRLEVYRDPEDGSWAAEVPDLPGCLAAGETAAEAIELVADAIDAWMIAAKADGRPVPGPRQIDDDYSGRTLLRLPKSLHRRVTVAARHDGVSLNTYCVMTLAQAVGGATGIAVTLGPPTYRTSAATPMLVSNALESHLFDWSSGEPAVSIRNQSLFPLGTGAFIQLPIEGKQG